MDKNIHANPVEITNKETAQEIISCLRYTYLLKGAIAREYNVDIRVVNDINNGIIFHNTQEKYPIRNWDSSKKALLTYEQVTNVIQLLSENELSFRKIAMKFNVHVSNIMDINKGSSKKYRRDGIKYPIRKYS